MKSLAKLPPADPTKKKIVAVKEEEYLLIVYYYNYPLLLISPNVPTFLWGRLRNVLTQLFLAKLDVVPKVKEMCT